ncbi:SDR family NAD(P)-dependent oxidoreductase [Thiolapillus brandeum]|uniref:Short-chain dehydrogenase/reductase n=1 Tax=Thiolapillus brandeum TaxID=1076588 RepID=A0A7U6JI47_9GAMM|nr:SDR family oxidoreductase [Thiolapillus brandeum]BAO43870.1 short-chain dehydrogenase/reductase [Thiolapillus brandeum]
MDLGIRGKRALVTGSTKGIGFATAVGLALEGCQVWVNGRSQASVDEALVRLRKAVPEGAVHGVVADLGTTQGCAKMIESVPEVDILVNNLGIFEPKPFAEIPDADWFRLFEVNVMSGVRLSRHYLPQMLEKDWGRIVFVSSESAVQIPEEMIHYGMTKTAQVAVARGLAEMTRGTGVTVNTVLPGPSRSEGVETFVQRIADQQGISFGEMERRFFSEVRPSSLLQRFATPQEDANMIVYLCSQCASATNGAPVRVEGGVIKAAL